MNITDEMLYAAAPEAAERWLDALPRREDCGHDFSLTFQAAMEPLLRRRRRRWKTLALLAAVIAALAGVLAFSAGADRPDEYRVYAAQEDGYAAYRVCPKHDGAGQAFHQLTPEWVPEGFVLMKTSIREDNGGLSYCHQEDPDNRFIYLRQWHGGDYASTLMGNYQMENVQVNGEAAILLSDSNSDNQFCLLIWTQGADAFVLTAQRTEREDIIRFANSLKW